MPRLLLFSALVGSPAQVTYRPSHFAVNHYSVSHAHWNAWNSRHAVTSASVSEEFPAARPERIRATVKLTRPAYRCGVYAFTRLLVDGQIVSALDAYRASAIGLSRSRPTEAHSKPTPEGPRRVPREQVGAPEFAQVFIGPARRTLAECSGPRACVDEGQRATVTLTWTGPR
jgi:hypothetical protein